MSTAVNRVAIGMLMAGWLGATQTQAQSPGGVSGNLQLWLKADAGLTGTTTATGWQDQSGNSRPITVVGAPALGSSMNFNPAITLSAGKYFTTAHNAALNPTANKVTIFGVTKPTALDFNPILSKTTVSTWDNGYGISTNSLQNIGFWHGDWTGTQPGYVPFVPYQAGVPFVATGFWDTKQNMVVNGAVSATATQTPTTNADQVEIGYAKGYQFVGDYAEVILYNEDIGAAGRQKVESYLAIKYGITLGQSTTLAGVNSLNYNYVNSSGSTVWAAAANSGYNYNIFGIGRDNTSGLHQKQSKSVNAAAFVTIGNGTGISASNAANSNAMTDQTFELVGDNGLSTGYANAYTPGSFTSSVPVYSMNRIWKVQETGTVGTVTISIPGNSTGTYLLVKSSSSFGSGATEIAMTPDGNGNLTAQVNLTDGQYFTFAKALVAPGGVTVDLQLWVKADDGVVASGSAVSQWTDQSIADHNLIQTTSAFRPLIQPASVGFNFNPSVKFDGIDDRLAYKLTRFMSTTSSGTFYGAASNAIDGGYENLGDLGIDNPHMGTLGNQQIMWMNSSAPVQINHPTVLTANKSTLLGYFWNGGAPNVGSGLRQNGTEFYEPTTEATAVGNSGPVDGQFTLGSYEGVENWNGNIAESFLYSRNLTSQEKDRVDTYLAIKYGTTLTHNYLASDGSVIYNVSSYSANIAGIGRDEASGLNQKQSRSVNTPGGLVTIGLGSGLVSANALNTNSFAANKSFEIIGDDGRPASYSALYTPTSFTPAGNVGFYRMARTWRVTETGTVGTVVVGVASSTGAEYLLVSNSASFVPANTQELVLTPDGNGNLVTTIDLADGQFFTFGAAQKAPGGVSSNLTIWLKSDAGVVTSGTAVTQWDNQALLNPYSLSQTAAANRPEYITSGSQMVNYNPTLYFKGAKVLYNPSSFMPGNSPFTFMMAAQDESADLGVGTLLSTADLFDYFEFNKLNNGTLSNGWNPYGVGGVPDLGPFGKGNKFSPAGGVNGWYNGTGYTRNVLTQRIQPQVIGFASANSVASFGTSMTTWTDGYKDTPGWSFINESAALASIVQTHLFKNLSVGADFGSAGTEPWEGPINEIIIYGSNLSDNEAQRVNTYLAIKNGVTLGQGNGIVNRNGSNVDYLATNSAVIWNATANSAYSYDIAGIGLDNFEGLNQKQSRSVNVGFQPAIGLGAVAESNEANPNVFPADKSYLIWGSNGLGTQYTVSYTPNSFTPVATFAIMNRVWKVQETGTVGTIAVTIPGSLKGVYLLVSNTNSFSTGNAGVTEYAMTPDGNGNLVATVDLTNGQFFTFGQDIVAPGCVTGGLDFWFDPAVGITKSGTVVTGWADRDSGGNNPEVTQATTTLQPSYSDGDAVSNYNPYINFANNQRLNSAITGSDYARSHTTFGVVNNYTFKGDYGHFIRLTNENNTEAGLHNWGLGHSNIETDNVGLHYIKAPFSGGSGAAGTDIYNKINQNRSIVIGQPTLYGAFIDSSTPSATSVLVGQNGNEAGWVGTANVTSLLPYDYMVIGGGNAYGMNNNKTSEIIHYSRALSQTERQRVNTYLGIKHGLTLEHNYLSGTGNTIYNISSYSANVTGIGREDCQGLLQKQSKSVNTNARMTISISGTVAATNATNPGSLTTDKTFVVIGDNGATGTTALSLAAASSCPPPPSADRYTNLSYKFTETGSAGPVLVQENLTGFGFNLNYPVYMQVFSDAGFTNLLVSVPMSYTNGIGTAIYDFPANATSYVRFAGNTTAPANLCVAPKAQTFHWNTWWYGDKQKVLLPNYTPASQSATAAMTMSVTVTDNNNMLLYRPTVDWWPVFDGIGLFIPRNDNASTENNVITTRMQFRQGTSTSVVAANTVSFKVWDVDGYIGGRDIVKIYGKQGSNIISPQLSRYTQWLPFDALQLNYQGSQQQAIGSNIPWDLGAWADVYVNFDTPVEEVFVEYRKDNTYNFNVYNDMRIGPVTVTCAPPKPKEPLVDNVYVYKEVAPNPQKTEEPFTYKFTVQNTNCVNKTINLTDNLPSGLVWRDSSFVSSTSLLVGSVNAYGNTNNLQLTNLTVPPGTHYFYATAKGSAAGTFLNQATYVVTNGTGATYLSDDPSETGTTAQPTPLTLIQNDPEANLTVQKTVNKTTAGQNEVLTYTYTITNPNAGSAVLSTFQDLLPGELTYVGGTLTGIGSATASPYSGSAVLAIRNLSVPGGSSLSFTVQANTNSFTIGAVANNIARVTPDVNSGFRIQTYNSSTASTTILVPPTVAILSPAASTTTALNPTVSGTATPGSTVVLTGPGPATLCTTTATVGGTWSCQVNLSPGEQSLTAIASNVAGASTPAITQITAVNQVTPFTTSAPPVKTASAGGTQTGNAATELVPTGGTTPFTYSNDTGNASCSAAAGATELPASSSLTVDSNTGSYSYVAPTTPGVYYFCIKVCDNSSPTPQCQTKTYTLVVSPVPASGNINCTSTQIIGAINQGTPGSGVLKITMTVSTTGSFPVSVSGSGFSLQILPTNLVANTGGTQTFYVPVNYSGATLGTLDLTITGAGTCTYNLAGQTPTGKNQPVMDIGGSCIAITPASLGK
ncbi:DUF11 domain-containing protein [Rudanella paleaurantiibacter]|nr:DUF11 domain-containing protein [Rudanella paleaurantiibacter]